MPFAFTIPGDILFTRMFGVFTASELDHLTSEVEIVEAEHPAAFDRITDVTAVERFDVSVRDIYHFAVRRSVQTFSRTIKSAIVADHPIQVQIAQLYQSLNENPQIQLRIFQSVADAKEWLANPGDRSPIN